MKDIISEETIHGLDFNYFRHLKKVSDTSVFSFLHLFFLNTVICICTKKGTHTDMLRGLTLKTPEKYVYKGSLNQKVFTSDFSERREGVYFLFVLEIMYERWE